ncbi:DUF3408 domain-containing protein [Alistipes indistinctus]|uniref:DUF3408 domain-containing protein n=1 Tax=Alistipes indistinctus YIT 12060 TaxID=742725 RepID=G5HBB6_9BACT|nr:DUF3408 domain-containing protein [Alistipes indistinctus]EHB91882.1 hypothetical protein HMPREF9450_01931 [Alistipes indistinctus YIT 12060]UWN59666.1 DUF3408 domain-containing protein [Alistipes indistinctus YIT 12060]
MPRKIIPPEDINEEYLRDLVGNVSPVLRNPDAAPVLETKPLPEAVQLPGESGDPIPATASKRRRISLPDYTDTFLHRVTHKRRVTINISEQMRETLKTILQHIGPFHLTLGGYIENILRNHVETYRDEINELNRNAREQKLL